MLAFVLTVLLQVPSLADGAGQVPPPVAEAPASAEPWAEAEAPRVLAAAVPPPPPLAPVAVPAATAPVSPDTVDTPDPVVAGLLSSFALPLGDLLEKEHDSEWRNLASGFSVSAATSVPLTRREPTGGLLGEDPLGRFDADLGPLDVRGSGTQGQRSQNLTLRAGLRYRPVSNWFAMATAYRYLRPEVKRTWDPDFVYALGYDDWRPHTLSLTYSNYGGNRFRPDREAGEVVTHLRRGALTAGYKFPMPEPLQRVFSATDGGRISHQLSTTLVPEYTTAAGGLGAWKHKVSLSTRYVVTGMWYVAATVNVYPRPSQQQPWDPDVVYSFGLFDWRPGRLSVQYANYSGTRFPWRERGPATGRFADGGVSFSWSTAF